MKKIIMDLQMSLQAGFRDPIFAAECLAFPAAAMLSQQLTLPAGVEIPIYTSTQAITDDQKKLTWTEDPRGGKLDVVKHPRFMAQAILSHPDYSGDCDDFTAHWCASLKKGKLADEIYHACCLWKDGGHAVCVFKKDDKWFWSSNWNGCAPINLPTRDFIKQAVGSYGSGGRSITRCAMWPVLGLTADDAVIYGPPIIL